VNNYLPVYEHPSLANKSTELIDLIRFVANEDDRTKMPISGNRKINYFPAKKVRLTVDSAKCVDNGIVPRELADKIVPYIDWEIRQNALFKNDLMVLDFLASSNWERALYLANPSSLNEILGIDRYIHQEGMVYKFMPVSSDDYITGIGGVNAEKSYDILLDCSWGGLNRPDVTVDRESYRNSRLPRQNFLRTAEALMKDGQIDKAVAVLDTCLYYFPDNKIRFDVLLIPFAELYYSAGEIQKANQVVERLVEIFGDDLRYYSSLDPGFARTYYNNDFQRTMSFMDRLIEMAGENDQKELQEKAENIFILYSR
jgi:tetratricopeptide (TPR) repeat protein